MAKKMIEDDFDDRAMFSPRAASANPLAEYFRVPGVHVTLPTGGAFLPPGALELDGSDTLPVLPMRAADEMLLKSPDALMSGYAIEKLLESCVPGLRTPKLVSTPDLDVLLLAIRAATYGETMDLEVSCPSCGTENAFGCHLPTLLSGMEMIPAENLVRLSPEIVVYVRPYSLQQATQMSLVGFNEARAMQALEDEGDKIDPAARSQRINEAYERITALNTELLGGCIVAVVTPKGTVSDPGHLVEFSRNISSQWIGKIDEAVKKLNQMGVQKEMDVVCSGCGHEWKTPIDFNPSSFFGRSS